MTAKRESYLGVPVPVVVELLKADFKALGNARCFLRSMSLSNGGFGRDIAELLSEPGRLVHKVVLDHPLVNIAKLLSRLESDIDWAVEHLF